MFTGIVTDVGEVLAVTPREAGDRASGSASAYDPDDDRDRRFDRMLRSVPDGRGARHRRNRSYFDVEASPETLARTTLGPVEMGTRVNLERSLKLGDELGGHHGERPRRWRGADRRASRRRRHGAFRTFEAPRELARFIAEKGSVSLDGTSLTVNGVDGRRFDVMIIPHTLAVTTWGERRAGDAGQSRDRHAGALRCAADSEPV